MEGSKPREGRNPLADRSVPRSGCQGRTQGLQPISQLPRLKRRIGADHVRCKTANQGGVSMTRINVAFLALEIFVAPVVLLLWLGWRAALIGLALVMGVLLLRFALGKPGAFWRAASRHPDLALEILRSHKGCLIDVEPTGAQRPWFSGPFHLRDTLGTRHAIYFRSNQTELIQLAVRKIMERELRARAQVAQTVRRRQGGH